MTEQLALTSTTAAPFEEQVIHLARQLCLREGRDPFAPLYEGDTASGIEPWGELWEEFLPTARLIATAVRAEREAIAALVAAGDTLVVEGYGGGTTHGLQWADKGDLAALIRGRDLIDLPAEGLPPPKLKAL